MKKIMTLILVLAMALTSLSAASIKSSVGFRDNYPERSEKKEVVVQGEKKSISYIPAEKVVTPDEAKKNAHTDDVPAANETETEEKAIVLPKETESPIVTVEGAAAPANVGEISEGDLDYLIGQLLDEKRKREGSSLELESEKSVDDMKWWQKPVEKAQLNYDVFSRTTKIRDTNFSFGGGGSIGVLTDSFRFEVYALADWFQKPIGGTGGAASLELMLETGATFAWKFMEVWRTRTFIELDVGYFAQLAMIPQQPGNLFVGFNGIMMRPKVVTHLQLTHGWDLSLGLFYQFPLYPKYDDYKGLGIVFGFV